MVGLAPGARVKRANPGLTPGQRPCLGAGRAGFEFVDGGTFLRSLFFNICLQDCYIEMAIRSARVVVMIVIVSIGFLRSRAKILGLSNFTAQARHANFPRMLPSYGG